jgi:hypothetical protein
MSALAMLAISVPLLVILVGCDRTVETQSGPRRIAATAPAGDNPPTSTSTRSSAACVDSDGRSTGGRFCLWATNGTVYCVPPTRPDIREDTNCPWWPDPNNPSPTADDHRACPEAPALATCRESVASVRSGNVNLASGVRYSNGLSVCIQVNADNGTYQQMDCRGHFTQQFTVTPAADGCYVIREAGSGKIAMQSDNPDHEDPMSIVGRGSTEVRCSAKSLWQIQQRSAGLWIRNKQTGLCIDVDGSDLHGEGRIHMLDCRDIGNQYWSIGPR